MLRSLDTLFPVQRVVGPWTPATLVARTSRTDVGTTLRLFAPSFARRLWSRARPVPDGRERQARETGNRTTEAQPVPPFSLTSTTDLTAAPGLLRSRVRVDPESLLHTQLGTEECRA